MPTNYKCQSDIEAHKTNIINKKYTMPNGFFTTKTIYEIGY